MTNIDFINSPHNQRLLAPSNDSFGCSFRNKSSCQLEKKCLTPKIIYQADVTNDVDEFCCGSTESLFKER